MNPDVKDRNMQRQQLAGLKERIFKIRSEEEFENIALEIFRYQVISNIFYKNYINNLGINIENVNNIKDIPCLPVTFFKNHIIITGDEYRFETLFKSSATTDSVPSKHYVKDTSIYIQSFRKVFSMFYGDVSEYCILALLPSYLERPDSSLVYMMTDLVNSSRENGSDFYLYNHKELASKLEENERKKQKTLLFGVTFALLDFVKNFPIKLSYTIIMETGGMKGRGEELTREEVHEKLMNAFGVDQIHSEYGMTEMLTQSYSKGKGIFHAPPWMKVLIRDIYDPLNVGLINENGAVNVIDLANFNSCSFLATDDAGIAFPDGGFRITGRLDDKDIRGCNNLI